MVRIQRFCVHDGPGIRTTVFLKGCPLQCLWCSNPETRGDWPEPGRDVIGGSRRMSVDEVVTEVAKDRPFFDRSGGGVTISGGEPLHQPAFTAALAARCKREGISTVLDTSGHAAWECLEQVLPATDIVHFDLKHLDAVRHRALAGADNAVILENCRKLSRRGVPLVLRVPLVPGLNDGDGDIDLLARFVSELPRYEDLHLLPYHRTGRVKYETLGIEYPLRDVQPPTAERIQHVVDRLRRAGIRPQVVF